MDQPDDDDADQWLNELILYNRTVTCAHLVAGISSIKQLDVCEKNGKGRGHHPVAPNFNVISRLQYPGPTQADSSLSFRHNASIECHRQASNAICIQTGCVARSQAYREVLDSRVLALRRTNECFSLIESNARLAYNLPKKGSLSGQVLRHCYKTLDDHLERQSPMTYKIGFTHCPYTRFYNSKFGYCKDRNKWDGMIAVFAASETISASFVEAAMIQRYMGNLFALII